VFGRKAAAPTANGLDSRARRRLERFAAMFDDIAEGDLLLFGGPDEPDAVLAEAMRVADLALGTGIVRAATKAAVQEFVHAAQVRFIERFSITALLGVSDRSRPSANDRVRVFKSLERTVVALVVWDRLDATEQAALAGPWRELVEHAVEGE
jgi:hypothetical protein